VGIGWELGLTGLGRYVAGGGRVNPAAAQAWAVSDEGRQFVTESSEQWSEAAVAVGIDAATARGWAARCSAFYTGQG
jgi:hypothetical protein